MTLPKSKRNKNIINPKPFVKWAGGKGNLIVQLEEHLPEDFDKQQGLTYIEPFVGGGAMLFHMLKTHKNISKVVINDINSDLIRCYQLIRNNPQELIKELHYCEDEFYAVSLESRRNVYEAFRDAYNETDLNSSQKAAYFIFLNKTCFNGLYRVNLKGKFNVPMGNYAKPTICDEELIMLDSQLLNSVDIEILNGDYSETIKYINPNGPNFIYFDPPYRPISNTAYFKEYSNSPFGDSQQEELKYFCDRLSQMGCKWMLSNSDSKNDDGSSYFEELYKEYNFQNVLAQRFINAFKREKQAEILIYNYPKLKKLILFPQI